MPLPLKFEAEANFIRVTRLKHNVIIDGEELKSEDYEEKAPGWSHHPSISFHDNTITTEEDMDAVTLTAPKWSKEWAQHTAYLTINRTWQKNGRLSCKKKRSKQICLLILNRHQNMERQPIHSESNSKRKNNKPHSPPNPGSPSNFLQHQAVLD
ncbi:hypothetical protein AVEN_52893-1 [Araneus ventricosus]|uniref:Uncharacterized protein n=1 Tax=Araneus ventricosus TaxID=182803 RepID=A0A4Y2R3E9_ARAVE|nr:hypothetical protein AVEN_52893-1 [Araneus ventricosus]